MQIPIIVKTRQMGALTIVADMDSNAPGFEFSDEQLIISTLDIEKLMEYAEKIILMES